MPSRSESIRSAIERIKAEQRNVVDPEAQARAERGARATEATRKLRELMGPWLELMEASGFPGASIIYERVTETRGFRKKQVSHIREALGWPVGKHDSEQDMGAHPPAKVRDYYWLTADGRFLTGESLTKLAPHHGGTEAPSPPEAISEQVISSLARIALEHGLDWQSA